MNGKELKKILDPWPLNHRIHRGLINLIKLIEHETEEQKKENERKGIKKKFEAVVH